jgi:hypothetical protein
MITGTLPFQADSAQEVMIKRLTDDPARLNDTIDGVSFPPQLQVVMDHAMERMPSDRYSSAEEFALEVLKATACAPVAAATPPIDTQGATQLMDTGPSDPAVTEQLKKTRQSEAQATMAMSELEEDSTADAEVPTAATAVSQVPPTHAPETPTPQIPIEAPRKKPTLAIAGSVVVAAIVGGVGYVTLTGGSNAEPDVGPDSAAIAALLTENVDSINSGVEDESRAEGSRSGTTTTPSGDERQDPGTQEFDNPNAASPNENPLSIEDILAEFVTLGRQVSTESSDQARASARNRLLEIYDMRDMPDSARARAAQIVAESYEEQSMSDACTWIDLAIRLQPDNENYRNYKEFILGCPF